MGPLRAGDFTSYSLIVIDVFSEGNNILCVEIALVAIIRWFEGKFRRGLPKVVLTDNGGPRWWTFFLRTMA